MLYESVQAGETLIAAEVWFNYFCTLHLLYPAGIIGVYIS